MAGFYSGLMRGLPPSSVGINDGARREERKTPPPFPLPGSVIPLDDGHAVTLRAEIDAIVYQSALKALFREAPIITRRRCYNSARRQRNRKASGGRSALSRAIVTLQPWSARVIVRIAISRHLCFGPWEKVSSSSPNVSIPCIKQDVVMRR